MSFNSEEEMKELNMKTTFLEQVLQLVETGAKPGEIYQLLEKNVLLLDDNFIQSLKIWSDNNLNPVNKEDAERNARNLVNFGSMIFNFSKGEEKINTEIAIAAYQESLTVLNRTDFPITWANILNNLSNVYTWRIRGEKVENIEKAINAYKLALEIFTKKSYPYEWARIEHNLGIAYRNRIREYENKNDENKNIDKAIECYQSALEVRKKDEYPVKWAETQLALAHAYGSKKNGDKIKNIEQSIKACKLALEVFSKEEYPYQWAETHNCLSLAYRDKIEVDGTDKTKDFQDFEEAITLLEAALKVFSKENYREAFARIQNNLGTIYRRRIKGEKAENLQKSITAYESALEVYTFDAFPYYYLEVLFNLGSCHLFANNLIQAYDAFKSSIDIIELFRNEIVSRLVEANEIAFSSNRERDKQKLAKDWNILYQNMIEVCLKLNQTTEAIEYAERSKTRNLVELILSRDFDSIFSPEIANQLKEFENKIQKNQAKIQDGTAKNPENIVKKLQELRQKRNELQDEYLPIGSGFNFDEFQNSLDDKTGIIYWYISNTELETFIITRNSIDRLRLPNPGDNLKTLDNYFKEYQESYKNNKHKWIKDLNPAQDSLLSRLAKILCIDQLSKHQKLQHCQRLIIIPHRYLHLLPLHALPLVGGEFLCERFPKGVGYAPSCQLLQLAQGRGKKRQEFKHLFAVENPTSQKPLLGPKLEINSIRQHFATENPVILTGNKASLSYLNQCMADLSSAHCVHFSCHGEFKQKTPLKSALILADPENTLGEKANLTLAKIFEILNLEQCRLVTFSSCETGMIDHESISDEYIGLSSGFLYAGAATVVSTLCTVDPLATALLLRKFYNNLKKVSLLESGSIAYALTQAQIWLKTFPSNRLERIKKSQKFKLLLDEVFDDKSVERRKFDNLLCAAINRGKSSEQPYPFANPYYWGCFIATGF